MSLKHVDNVLAYLEFKLAAALATNEKCTKDPLNECALNVTQISDSLLLHTKNHNLGFHLQQQVCLPVASSWSCQHVQIDSVDVHGR